VRAANRLQRMLVEETRLGIPAMFHEECLVGLLCKDATLFPSSLNYGSTWDPALVEQAAQAIVQAQRLRLAVRQGVAFGGLETLVGAEDEWLLAAVQRNAVVAQRFEKGQAIGVGRRRPVFEQVGATAVVGSGEVLRRSGVGRHREKGGQDQDTGMERAGEEGKGHAGVPGRRAVWLVPRPLPEGRGGR